ncbi:putative tetrahydrocannabinolic acid synthase [Helianthus anomalus]
MMDIFHKYQYVLPNFDCDLLIRTTIEFGGFNISTPTSVLANRSAIPKLSFNGKLDYVPTPIPKGGLRKLWRKMFRNDNSKTLFMFTFGGKMEEYSDTAIPYPHRAGVLYQVFKRVDFVDQPSDKTLISLRRLAWLRSFDKTLELYVTSNPREAYMNYNDLDLGFYIVIYKEASVWGERYWKR